MNKKLSISIILLLTFFATSFAQVTYRPYVKNQNNNCIIEKVELTNNETIVTILVPSSKNKKDCISFSSLTQISPGINGNGSINRKILQKDYWSRLNTNYDAIMYFGSMSNYELHQYMVKQFKKEAPNVFIKSLGNEMLDTWYKIYNETDTYYRFSLHFNKLSIGCENFYILELHQPGGGWYWEGIKINNPYPKVANVGLNENEIKQNINENNDGICGIYEDFDDTYKLACIKQNGEYILVYLDNKDHWKYGDVKAYLRQTATPGFFKADWHMYNKTKETDAYVAFDGATMKTVISRDESNYIKMYPTASSITNPSQNQEWSGSGFALKDGYIVTNYHVIEGAKSIQIQGVKGDFTIKYNAEVIATDKFNDLALLKVSDSKFAGFGTIPYNVKTSVSDVGEDIFVLGYPLTSTMGDEIKLTTGVISSKTGFQGDVSLYQISAPIQPGNSGGPLFDNKGNLVGIVNAKHTGAENVGYAIKTSYLRNLIESSISTNILPTNPQTATLSLPEKVKKLKNFVFMISCSNMENNSYSNKKTTVNSTNQQSYNCGENKDSQYPSLSFTTAKNAKIKSVKVTKDYTAIEIISNNQVNGGDYYQFCNIDKDAYIFIPSIGKKYTMTRAEGIKIAPEKTYYSYEGEDITFTLYFPPIPENTTSINFIESVNSTWKFYGIELK